MAQGDKPVKEFRAGSVRASIWQDEVVGRGDEPFSAFGVQSDEGWFLLSIGAVSLAEIAAALR